MLDVFVRLPLRQHKKPRIIISSQLPHSSFKIAPLLPLTLVVLYVSQTIITLLKTFRCIAYVTPLKSFSLELLLKAFLSSRLNPSPK